MGSTDHRRLFVKKVQRDRQLIVWSDTTESHVHTDKSYYQSELGKLMYEVDYYKPLVDSVWLKQRLGLDESEQLESWTFNRTFYPDKIRVTYDILFRLKDGPHTTLTLNDHVGDSLFRTLK